MYLGSNKGGLREKGAGRADEALENPFFLAADRSPVVAGRSPLTGHTYEGGEEKKYTPTASAQWGECAINREHRLPNNIQQHFVNHRQCGSSITQTLLTRTNQIPRGISPHYSPAPGICVCVCSDYISKPDHTPTIHNIHSHFTALTSILDSIFFPPMLFTFGDLSTRRI